MKKIFTLLFVAALVSDISYGQAALPNGDFENWSTSGGSQNPAGWSTSDDIVTGLGLGLASPGGVVQDTIASDVYSGLSSALLTTKAVTIPTLGAVTFAGSMMLGSYGFSLSGLQLTLGGAAYSDRPDSIEFAYKYNLPFNANDSGVVKINLSKATVNDGTIPVGSATIYLQYNPSYTLVKAKINYVSAQNPDTLKIQVQSSAALFMKGANGAQLWVDAMQFVGLDTTFRVYLTPDGPQSKCAGDVITVRTDDITGDSYAWSRNGSVLPDTLYKLTTGVAGNYALVVTHDGTQYNSDTLPFTINPLPSVSLNGAQDTVCDNGGTVRLAGGTPAGGSYTGTGVSGGIFTPSTSHLGSQTITYTYTDANGCTAANSNSILYVAGCSVGIEVLQSDAQINMYPNPAFSQAFITGNDRIIGGSAYMYDEQGRLVSTIALYYNQTIVNLSTMSAGSYTIVISDAKAIILAKAKIVVAK